MDFIKKTGVKFEKWVTSTYQSIQVRFRLYSETKTFAAKCNGSTILSEVQKKQLRDYYSKYFKVNKSTYVAHTHYLEKTGVFDVKFIPDPIWYAYIDPYLNDWTLDKYIDNKCYYTRMFPTAKMPRNVFYRLNNYWYDKDDKIVSVDEVKKGIVSCKTELFLKNANAYFGCGSGVTYFNPQSDAIEEIDWILSKSRYDYVVQEAIKQHEVLAAINPSSVNTIRTVSLLKKDGTVKICSSVLRIGRDGNKLDNWGTGGVSCGIDDDGRLKKLAFDRKGNSVDRHPDNGYVFEDTTIPNFNEVLEMVKSLAPTIPHFRLVSWDIAIDENGHPVLVEMNSAYGEPELHQFSNGPIFGEDTEEVLEEVFEKKR